MLMQNIRILVCMKQVPENNHARLDAKHYTIKRDSAKTMENPSDCVALEYALRLKAQVGAHVTVFTMGPVKAVSILDFAKFRGADEIVLLNDEMFAGSDSLATARVIAAASEKLGNFDIVFTGRRAIDGETGHVGPQLSVLLGMQCVTNVTDITSVDEHGIYCVRLLEGAQLEVNATIPCVLTMCGNKNILRQPSLKAMRAASKIQVKTLSNEDLQLPKDMIGIKGSPTNVYKLTDMEMKDRSRLICDELNCGVDAILKAVEKAEVATNLRASVKAVYQRTHLDGKVWVFAWQRDDISINTALQLAGAVKSMGVNPCLIYIGKTEAAKKLFAAGFKRILQYDEKTIYSESACAKIVVSEAKRLLPEVILFPATIRGRNIAPQCAAMLATGLTADCIDFKLSDGGALTQIRPAYGGSKIAYVECKSHRPQLASVRPGVYETPKAALPELAQATVERILVDGVDGGLAETIIPTLDKCLQSDAEIVVAGGKGVGSKEGFELLGKLAAALGGALGASRGAVDSGFAPYSCQIGQTGITIRPRVYLAFGISGATHHLVGMKDSETIIAVNNDPKAQLFSYVDIGVVMPWDEVAQALLEDLSEKSNIKS